jgi:predicted dehydrogenase
MLVDMKLFKKHQIHGYHYTSVMNVTPLFPERVLICGFGSIGKRYLAIISECYQWAEIAVLRSSKANPSQNNEFSGQTFYSFRDAIKWKPDICIVANAASAHIQYATTFAEHGVPLLIEKPLAVDSEGVEDITRLEELSKNVVISVGYLFRYDPIAERIGSIVRQCKLGRLVDAEFYCGSWLPSWREADYRNTVSACAKLGGGVLLELSHEIDLAAAIFGDLAIVSSHLYNASELQIDVEDSASLYCKSALCESISIRLNFCTQPARRYVSIRGTHGELYWDLFASTLKCYDCSGDLMFKMTGLSRDELIKRELDNLLWCCTDRNGTPRCTVKDAMLTLELIKKARTLSDGKIFE